MAFSARLRATTRSMRGRIASCDVVRALEPKDDSGSCGALLELHERLLEHRLHGRSPERDDARARLELAQEEHLVDELRDLVDLAARLVDERGDVLAGKRRRLEQGEQARERRAQLVRDGGREARAQLLVGREVTFAGQVDETLAPAAHLVRDDQRDDAALAGEEIRRAARSPSRRPSTACRARRLASRTRSDVVEDDDRLAALLDERPPPDRVGVRHVTRF